jgi:hypothetical protein
MHEVVINKTNDLVEVARFISFSYDEVNAYDQQSLVPFMHIWLKIGNGNEPHCYCPCNRCG